MTIDKAVYLWFRSMSDTESSVEEFECSECGVELAEDYAFACGECDTKFCSECFPKKCTPLVVVDNDADGDNDMYCDNCHYELAKELPSHYQSQQKKKNG
jgi:hypothetical protein